MPRMIRRVLVVAALIAPLSLPALAQPLFWVHREGAIPSKLAEYEAVTKDFATFVKTHRDVMPTFHFETWSSPDLSYTYVTGIGAGLGGGDVINAELMAAGMKLPEFQNLWHRGGDSALWWTDTIYTLRDDLSYTAPMERLKPEEQMFAQMDFYYIKPGYAADADQVAMAFKALYEKKKGPNSYLVLQAVTGDTPLILVRTLAKDPADYWMNREKEMVMLGAEGEALFARAFALTRKFDSLQFFRRPDLSLMPPSPPKK